MAKAVFHQDFNYSSRKRNVGWGIDGIGRAADLA